jgi:hypothetical protein
MNFIFVCDLLAIIYKLISKAKVRIFDFGVPFFKLGLFFD